MRVLAVEEDQVRERLLREGRVVQEEVQFFETGRCVLFDVHQGRVMECNWIQFILVSWWHVEEGFPSYAGILHGELDGGLEIEGLDQGSFFQGLGVTDRLDINTLRIRSNSQLRVLPNTLLNNISNMLERGSQLFQFIIAQRDVISDIALIARRIQSFSELRLRLIILLFFIEDAAFGD